MGQPAAWPSTPAAVNAIIPAQPTAGPLASAAFPYEAAPIPEPAATATERAASAACVLRRLDQGAGQPALLNHPVATLEGRNRRCGVGR